MDDDRDWKAVGARLAAARKAVRLTQKEAAEKAGVHAVSVSRWEGGQPIRDGDLRRLAEVYRTTPAALLGEEPTPEPARGPTAEELLPGYWRGALRTIIAHHDRVGDELREFLSAGERWEVGSALAGGAVEGAVEGASVPRPSDEEMAALQAVRRRRIAQKMRELEEHGPPREPPNAPPAPKRRAGGE